MNLNDFLGWGDEWPLPLRNGGVFQLDLNEASEFTGEIDGDPCMHRTLFVVEALPALDWENPLVPYVRMYVKPSAARACWTIRGIYQSGYSKRCSIRHYGILLEIAKSHQKMEENFEHLIAQKLGKEMVLVFPHTNCKSRRWIQFQKWLKTVFAHALQCLFD